MSPSQSGGNSGVRWWSEGGVAAADQLAEITIDHTRSGLQQQVRAAWRPTHRLSFIEAFVHNLVDRGLHEAGGDPFPSSKAFTVVDDVTNIVANIRGKLA
jgi:hypothetical protein